MGLLREVRLVLAFASLAIPAVARADADLVVTRNDGAAECPDAAEVRRLALAELAPSLPPPAHAYHVSFDRSAGAYRAEILDDTAGRTRHLEDRGPGCGPLGQAVAEVMATMWSSERDDATRPVPAPAPPPAPSPTESPPPHRVMRWAFDAGPALAVAIVRPAAPALFGDGAVEFTHGSLGLGALWIPAQEIAVAPGSIEVQLISGTLRGCAFSGNETHLGLCAKALAGLLRAEGRGYSADARRIRPWLAIEPEVYLDHSLFGWVRGRAAAGAIVPLHAESFSVTGAGPAYATPTIGGLASLSLEIATP